MDNSILYPALFAIAIVLLGLALASGGNDKTAVRVKEVAKSNERQLKRKTIDADEQRRKKLMGNLKDLEMKEKQLRAARVSLTAQLEQAGLSITPQNYWMMSLGAGLFAAAIMFLLHKPIYMIGGAGVAAGLGLPRWVVNFLKGMRQKKFTAEFANAIEVIVRGVKSGLPLMECLKVIGREAQEPLASEFRRVTDQTAMGIPLDQALGKMFERMPLPEVSFFTIVLAIQQKAGGNLSEALGNLATVLRARKLMKEKVNALSSEAKASAMIIGALPIAVTVMVYFTSPDYIMQLFTDKTGHFALMVGGGMMLSGVLVMRQMINFDI